MQVDEACLAGYYLHAFINSIAKQKAAIQGRHHRLSQGLNLAVEIGQGRGHSDLSGFQNCFENSFCHQLRCRCFLDGCFIHYPDEGKLTIVIVVIESIADDEQIRYLETGVVWLKGNSCLPRLRKRTPTFSDAGSWPRRPKRMSTRRSDYRSSSRPFGKTVVRSKRA